jgi:hypothetical protein
MISILSKILKSNKIQVVGIFEDSDDLEIIVLTLKKEKNKLIILDSQIYDSFESFEKSINLKLPTILCYNGKKVLNKKVDITNETDVNWKKNLDLNTVYHLTYSTENNIFISFCRKEIIDTWIQKLISAKIQIIDVYLGSFVSIILSNVLNSETYISDRIELQIKDSKLIDFSKMNSFDNVNYDIGNSQLSNFELPLYSAALCYFTDNLDFEKSAFENLKEEELIYKKAFNYLGVGSLVLFFISLLMSYFLIQYFIAKNAELNVENLYSNKSYQEILLLETQIKEKEELINKSGFLSKHLLSYYSFEILNSLPNSISLDKLYINPLQKEIKENENIQFIPYQIVINGITKNENEFNVWIKNIKIKNWLKKIEIKSIKTDKKNNIIFELIITIN